MREPITMQEPAATDATPVATSTPPVQREREAACDRETAQRIDATFAAAEAALAAADRLDGATDSPPATDAPLATERGLSVSIVMPVYNERDTIEEIVARVRAVGIHDELIIVDDFSVDGTRAVLLELAELPDVRVCMHGYNRGKGAALRTGFSQVRGDVVMIQDADLEYDPRDLPALLEPLVRGEADVVYGSRFLADAHQDPSRLHRFGNWLLTQASNLATGQRLTDMETCYKAVRRSVLAQLELEQERFGFEPEITGKISRLGVEIRELPIRYASRGYEEGKKIGVRDGLNALWCIWRYRRRLRADRR